MKLPFSLLLCTALCATASSYAADVMDFSGSYTLTGNKGARQFDKSVVTKLNVIQKENEIEVTESVNGHVSTNRYPLNGRDAGYTSPGGPRGTCKAFWKGKTLILESIVASHPQANGPLVQIHTKQKWELSSDLKTLRIHVDVDSPQSPINIIEPWTEIYTRDESGI